MIITRSTIIQPLEEIRQYNFIHMLHFYYFYWYLSFFMYIFDLVYPGLWVVIESMKNSDLIQPVSNVNKWSKSQPNLVFTLVNGK